MEGSTEEDRLIDEKLSSDWQTATHFLQAREYERAAQLIRETQHIVEQYEHHTLALTLTAAYQICLTGNRYLADIENYEQAYRETVERERLLRRQLEHLLALADDIMVARPVEPAEEDEPGPSTHLPVRATGSPGLGERFTQWLHGLTTRWTADDESQDADPPLQAELPALPSPPAEPAPPLVEIKPEKPPQPRLPSPAGRDAEPEELAQPPQPTPPDAEPEESAQPPQPTPAAGDAEESVQPPQPTSIDDEPQEQAQPLQPTPAVSEVIASAEAGVPVLAVYCLGPLRVYQDEHLIERWPSNKGKSIFKYLITHRKHPVAKEVLMELFWPDADPDAARNNLNVAIYGLRQALRDGYAEFSHVLFQDDHYLLNPEMQIWVDVEAFRERFQTGRDLERRANLERAVQAYHVAAALYQGEFLAEDRYEDWLMPERQQLQDTYLKILDRLSDYYFQKEEYAACITACRQILAVEACREKAHRRLMRCYGRQKQYYLALRQYHTCCEAMQNQLDVAPAPQTVQLYERIRRHEAL